MENFHLISLPFSSVFLLWFSISLTSMVNQGNARLDLDLTLHTFGSKAVSAALTKLLRGTRM